MIQTVNKGCLQKLQNQTYTKSNARPRPHIRCPVRLQAWLARQEAKIDDKYRHSMAVKIIN